MCNICFYIVSVLKEIIVLLAILKNIWSKYIYIYIINMSRKFRKNDVVSLKLNIFKCKTKFVTLCMILIIDIVLKPALNVLLMKKVEDIFLQDVQLTSSKIHH